jgi:hypothetical protein
MKKSNTKTESHKKFKPKENDTKSLFSQYLKTNKNIKTLKFWFLNVLTAFFILKSLQFFIFIKEFSYTIPKEQMKVNMLNLHTAKGMKPEILHKYLDELEAQKEERKKYLK